MIASSFYPPADSTVQWFGAGGPAAPPQVVVLHTTEGTGWPGYEAGMTAPHLTGRPDLAGERIVWRQHLPLERSARALQHPVGTVETNNRGAVQVELVGTCAISGPGLHWPSAPAWALRDVAALLAWLSTAHQIPLQAPLLWPRYPKSYGPTTARMSPREWSAFRGVCGHLHVPHNAHGDPGDLPIRRLLDLADRIIDDNDEEADVPLTDNDLRKIASMVWRAEFGPPGDRQSAQDRLAGAASTADLEALEARLLAALAEHG